MKKRMIEVLELRRNLQSKLLKIKQEKNDPIFNEYDRCSNILREVDVALNLANWNIEIEVDVDEKDVAT